MPDFRPLPDSSLVNSFFDYYRGDYGLDKLNIGVKYHSKNQLLNVSGFKRSSQGNYGHYIHPTNNAGPIHQSYRIDYSKKSSSDQIEVSAARFITSSGIPDITNNGFDNDNIISSGIKYERNFETWRMQSYLSQFAQTRTLSHSLYDNFSSCFINRNQLDLQIGNSNGYEFGLSQRSQQFNSNDYLRSVAWSSIYFTKYFSNFSIMSGIQLSEKKIYQPFIFSANYINRLKYGEFNVSVSSESQPRHPDVNKFFFNDFETKQRSSINYKISKNRLFFESYVTSVKINAEKLYDYNQNLYGFNIVYNFNSDWNVYNKSIFSNSSSKINTFGSIFNSGLKGRFLLFQNNMDINFHIWQDSFFNNDNSFSYDPFLQYHHGIKGGDFAIIDRNLIHIDIQLDISGVLMHYKIYNVLNALGIENENTFFKPNAIYPEIGRMIQFGVTWYFDN